MNLAQPTLPTPTLPVMYFNDVQVEGAALSTAQAIVQKSIAPVNGYQMPARGFEKFIPLLIIGLVLYFIFK